MKFFICSDIHGSEFFCKKTVEAFIKSKADKLIILGDVLYHGPRNDLPKGYNPKAVIELLNPLKNKILCVRGNCDAEVDQMVLDFPILATYAVLNADNKTFYLTHGHHLDEIEAEKDDVILYGHTHIPEFEKKENGVFINCGSVSIPKENSPHSYIIFENNKFDFYDLEKDEIYQSKEL